MGLFDSILKDIADGGLEKKLEKLADSVEHLSTKLDQTVGQAADKPVTMSKKIEQAQERTNQAVDGTIKPTT